MGCSLLLVKKEKLLLKKNRFIGDYLLWNGGLYIIIYEEIKLPVKLLLKYRIL